MARNLDWDAAKRHSRVARQASAKRTPRKGSWDHDVTLGIIAQNNARLAARSA